MHIKAWNNGRFKTPFTRDRSDLGPVQFWHRTAFRSHGTDETGLVLDRQSVLVWDQVKESPVLDRHGSELVRSRINTSTGLVLAHFHGRGLKSSTVLAWLLSRDRKHFAAFATITAVLSRYLQFIFLFLVNISTI